MTDDDVVMVSGEPTPEGKDAKGKEKAVEQAEDRRPDRRKETTSHATSEDPVDSSNDNKSKTTSEHDKHIAPRGADTPRTLRKRGAEIELTLLRWVPRPRPPVP